MTAAEFLVVDTVVLGLEQLAQVTVADQQAGTTIRRRARFEQAGVEVEAHGYGWH